MCECSFSDLENTQDRGKLWGMEKNILFKDYSETWLLNKVPGKKKRSLPTCDKTDVKNL